MSKVIIDVLVVAVLFGFGISWTVLKYAKHDRAAFAAVAILAPVICIVSLVRLIYLKTTGNLRIGPVPNGLEEAEIAVAKERQRLVGGPLRQPTLTKSWQRAYEVELQQDAERVQRFAHRIFATA